VWYLGARAIAFAMNAFCAASSSLGGVPVRVETRVPTSAKNFSCPGGEHMHNNRAGCCEMFLNTCGALAGTLNDSPALAVVVSPRSVTSTVPSRTLNISSKSCRWGGGAGGGDVHVDQRVAIGRFLAADQGRVGVPYHTPVRQGLIVVGPRDRSLPRGVVVGDRLGGGRCLAAEIERRVSQQLVKGVPLLLAHRCLSGSWVRASARRAAARSGTSGRARSPWR
jgi:hypothetical protein